MYLRFNLSTAAAAAGAQACAATAAHTTTLVEMLVQAKTSVQSSRWKQVVALGVPS
jgi:hypothetical protein